MLVGAVSVATLHTPISPSASLGPCVQAACPFPAFGICVVGVCRFVGLAPSHLHYASTCIELLNSRDIDLSYVFAYPILLGPMSRPANQAAMDSLRTEAMKNLSDAGNNGNLMKACIGIAGQ